MSDTEDSIVDCDIGDDIDRLFTKFTISAEEATSLKKEYVLFLDQSSSGNTLAAGLSNCRINLYDLGSGKSISLLDSLELKEEQQLCGLKFDKEDPNMLYAGVQSGSILLFDCRTKDQVFVFEQKERIKPLTSFDLNSNSRILSAGTEVVQSEAFILFFDVRERKLVGGYWDSHSDDITQIKFHNSDPNLLASGSTDGLINIFNIAEKEEDEALVCSFNTESSVNVINWHKKDLLSCITDINELLVYDTAEMDLISRLGRETVTEAMRRKSAMECNLINCHNIVDDQIALIATSNFNNGECLRTLKYEDGNLKPLGNFIENKQIIRSSLYNTKENYFVTGGEMGIITLWRLAPAEDSGAEPKKTALKESHKSLKVHHKAKPY